MGSSFQTAYFHLIKHTLLLAPDVLIACSQPEPVFTDANYVREAIMQIENAQFRVYLTEFFAVFRH